MTEDLEIVSCSRKSLTLTKRGCAKLWISAQNSRNPPRPWEGRAACIGCADGAERAGRPVTAVVEVAERLNHVCPRCLRPAPRLINGWLCVSCYNRHREVLVGRNAKGSRPQLTALLHAAQIVVADETGVREARREQVTGRMELLLLAAKNAKRAMLFSVPPAQWGIAA